MTITGSASSEDDDVCLGDVAVEVDVLDQVDHVQLVQLVLELELECLQVAVKIRLVTYCVHPDVVAVVLVVRGAVAGVGDPRHCEEAEGSCRGRPKGLAGGRSANCQNGTGRVF